MWNVILEKAMAKLQGNYEHMYTGDPRVASRILNGSPNLYYRHVREEVTVEFLWKELLLHDANDEMIIMNTFEDPSTIEDDCGLHVGHAYVALTALKLSNGARLVQMRNPWASEQFRCAYSDSSDLWTSELREEAGATEVAVNEGIFFMTIEDYYSLGLSTIFSFDTTDWHYDAFLMLNDQNKPNGLWPWCGKTCTRHIIVIESEV